MIRAYFNADHYEAVAEYRALRSSLDRAARDEAVLPALRVRFGEFRERLERRIRWEEEVLFPEVERRAPDLARQHGWALRAEHEDVRRFLAIAAKHLRRLPRTGYELDRVRELLDRLLALLAEHGRREEETYYPLAEETFTPQEEVELINRMRALR